MMGGEEELQEEGRLKVADQRRQRAGGKTGRH